MPGDVALTEELHGAEAQALPNVFALMAYSGWLREAWGGNEDIAPLAAGAKTSHAPTDKARNPQQAAKARASRGEVLMAAVRSVIMEERSGAWK
jgi:hypothetical protein